MPKEVPDPAVVVTPLFEHQQKALWWLVNNELDQTAEEALSSRPKQMQDQKNAGIWQQDQRSGYWRNVFTKDVFREPPKMHRGGILVSIKRFHYNLFNIECGASDGTTGHVHHGVRVKPCTVHMICHRLRAMSLTIDDGWYPSQYPSQYLCAC